MKPRYTSKQADDILSMFEGCNSMDKSSIRLAFGAFRATIEELRRYEESDKAVFAKDRQCP